MSKIRTNAVQLLQENYYNTDKGVTLREYVECEASSDPWFFAWLFNEEIHSASSLTDEHKEEYNSFLNNLQV